MSYRKMRGATRLRSLAVGVLVCGGAVGAASIDLAGSTAAARGSLSVARAAEVKNVNQTMTMDVASIKGNTISAHGQAVSGQINGIVSFNLTLQNGARAVMNFSIYNNGHIGKEHRKGTVQGNGDGNYHASGALSYFTGRILGIHGSEDFNHAKNLGVTVTGTLNRRTYKLTATLKGKVVE